MKRLTIKDMNKLAGIKGGTCSSDEYEGSRVKLKWRCKKGHVWETTPKEIKKGSWCPKCAKVTDLKIKEMQKIAEDKGGKCLSEKYIDGYTKLRWQCKKGHEWEMKHDSIKQGKWCPVCSEKVEYTIKDMHALAENKGGKCLSKKYLGKSQSLKWFCKEGHEWEAIPDLILKGRWCPTCAKEKDN